MGDYLSLMESITISLTSMIVVFLILNLLAFFIWLFNYKRKEKITEELTLIAEKTIDKEVKITDNKNAIDDIKLNVAEIETKVVKVETDDKGYKTDKIDAKTMAIITAAASYYMQAEDNVGLRIREIKRGSEKRSTWAKEGLRSLMENKL